MLNEPKVPKSSVCVHVCCDGKKSDLECFIIRQRSSSVKIQAEIKCVLYIFEQFSFLFKKNSNKKKNEKKVNEINVKDKECNFSWKRHVHSTTGYEYLLHIYELT